MPFNLDLLLDSREFSSASSGSSSVSRTNEELIPEILSALNEGTDAKQAEGEEVREAGQEVASEGEEVIRAGASVAAEVANFSESQTQAIEAETTQTIAGIDAGDAARQESMTTIDSLRGIIEDTSSALSGLQEEENRVNMVSQGRDPDTGEELGVFGKTIAALGAPGRLLKRAWINDKQNQEYQQLSMAQSALANQFAQLQADAAYDPNYLQAQKDYANATKFARIDEVNVAANQDLYKLAMDEYGLEQQDFTNLIQATQVFNETERPQMMMQLLGLKMENDRLSFAQQDEERQKSYINLITTASQNAGIDIDEDTIRVAADRWYRNDLAGLSELVRATPEMVGILANARNIAESELLIENGIDMATSFADSTDPELKAQGQVYQSLYNGARDFVLQDESTLGQIRSQLVSEGLQDPMSEEYKTRLDQLVKAQAEQRAGNEIQRARQNSIGYLREQGSLQGGVTSALQNYWNRAATDPNMEVDAGVQRASAIVAQNFDRDMDAFQQNPSGVIRGNYTAAVRSLAGKDATTPLTVQDFEIHAERAAEAAALVMKQLQDINTMTYRTDPLFKGANFQFNVDFPWQVGAPNARNIMTGKDLTDPATHLFGIRNSAQNLTNQGRNAPSMR